MRTVVLFAVDLAAGAVLFPIDLLEFGASEFSAVRGAVGVDLLIDAFLILFSACCLAACHLAAANALRNAVLLIFLARAYFAFVVLLRGVVLVSVD